MVATTDRQPVKDDANFARRDAEEDVGERSPVVPVLRAAGQVRVPARPKPFDPSKFFRTRKKALWVSGDFRNLILSATRSMGTTLEIALASFDVVRVANDAKIRAELPKNHVFEDASAFCAYLASMISRQSKGELGDLLVNCYMSIFYVLGANGEVFTVSAYWGCGSWEWYVHACRFGDYRGHEGNRVFSSNC